MLRRLARSWVGHGHRLLLVIWRYLPLTARRFAIRVLFPRFPVGAVAIIRDASGRILLVRQTYHRAGVRWAAPGGWLAHGENPRQAAARETFEETGLRVTVGRVLEIGSGPYREVSLAFECRVIGDGGFRTSVETDRIGYFSPSDLPPMTAETRRLLERALAVQALGRADDVASAPPAPQSAALSEAPGPADRARS
jgi:ADP-ribose pyrophosphatase YjhB (NUDIX family)